MELTRRDAIAVLTAGSAGVGFSATAIRNDPADRPSTTEEAHVLGTFVAFADEIYPTEVSGINEFVKAYVMGRSDDRGRWNEYTKAVDTLDTTTDYWFETTFVDLKAENRSVVLQRMGIANVEPDPDGNGTDHVRYYVFNELLYALYTSPVGGKLAGLENPEGHPGGIESYQQGARGE
jgi:hypothetical protein